MDNKPVDAIRLESWNNSTDVKEILSVLPRGEILEIGCGTGKIIEELSSERKNCFFTGIDINSSFIEIAKQKKIMNANFIVADILTLINEGKQFDAVLFRDSLHEIRESYGLDGVRKTLTNVFQILKPEGLVIIRDAIIPQEVKLDVYMDEKTNQFFKVFVSFANRKINYQIENNHYILSIRDLIFFLSKLKNIELGSRDKLTESIHFSIRLLEKILSENFIKVEIREYKYPLKFFKNKIVVKEDLPNSYAMFVYKKGLAKPNK